MITEQPKIFENPSIVAIKQLLQSIQELPKTIRQVEIVSQVGSNSSLYSDTKKVNLF